MNHKVRHVLPRWNFIHWILGLLLIMNSSGLLPATPVQAATIRYVKPGGNGNCITWETACDLQTALDSAISGDEIWVAQGIHKPTTDPSDREATFQLKNGVAIYGGFVGTETELEQRDFASNITVLSGDIDNNDHDIIIGENSYTIIIGSGVIGTSIIDGFTVTAGQEDRQHDGSGMYNDGGSPTLRNITFSGNYGVGMFNRNNSNPTLTNVTFSSNSNNGMSNINSNPTLTDVTFSSNLGCGMYNNNSNPTLTDVTFSNNSSGGMYNRNNSNSILINVNFSSNDSGGMYNHNSNPILTNVTFSNNSSGGMYNHHNSSPKLTNVIFDSNSATYGGGMYNENNSNPTLIDVIFSGNSATYGGGMYIGRAHWYDEKSSPTLINVTFNNNVADYGGGMYNNQGNPILTNVTFSNNTATYFGGGLRNNSTNSRLLNSTFSNNTASCGGGIANNNSSLTLLNITFSGNTAEYGSGIDNYSSNYYDRNLVVYNTLFVRGAMGSNCTGDGFDTSSSHNLADDTSCTGIATSNINLGTLGNYGGKTQTIPLLSDSAAIDVGNNTHCPKTDQRDIARSDGLCDVGAFEYDILFKAFLIYLPITNKD